MKHEISKSFSKHPVFSPSGFIKLP